ncbi:M55 family metallopeptidase [Paenibacillus elgii]|uniref:M55 family metallopeptidase n=1 Tax=Paenibacillus elgii TaxID=189691 RepID=UPI000A2F498F
MKIFISADMEGISGVVDPTFLHPGESNYDAGCRLMAHDVGRDRVQRDLCGIVRGSGSPRNRRRSCG